MNFKFIIVGLNAIIAALIWGCTSSGPVSMGQNSYMIARTQWGFAGTTPIKGDALREAGDFCKKHGKVLKVTKTVETGLKFGSEPAAEVYFQCLDPNDPALKQATPLEQITR